MILKNGSNGSLVEKLQEKLGLKADGGFGPVTEAALKKWQSENGLEADGIAGEVTLGKLGISLQTDPNAPVDFDSLKSKVPAAVLELMPAGFAKYGITTAIRAAHFIAQIAHESGNFTIKTESLYYTTPQRIVDTWETRFNLDGSDGKKNAHDYIRNEEKLAEAVYGGRMGNTNPGDGFRFRGGGFLQLTGKESFQGYAKYLGKSVEETSDLLRSDNFYALDAALWEYCINMKLNQVADQGTSDEIVKKITRVVNGGYNGLNERQENFDKFYETLAA